MRAARQLLPVLLVLLSVSSLPAQASGPWSRCTQDSLSTWNCASYYSGTVTLVSTLKAPGLQQSRTVTATIAGGRVTCRIQSSDEGEFESPGMLAVTHESTTNAGGYEISVWCAEAGSRPTRREYPVIEIMKRRATDYGTLDGTDSWDHPDSDEVNEVSGKETVTWKLRRT